MTKAQAKKEGLTPALVTYYKVTSKKDVWELRCKAKGCGSGWALKKPGGGVGNTLALLNHAMGHKEKKKK